MGDSVEAKYEDGVKSHGLKGTALPGAKGNRDVGVAVNKGSLDAPFPLHEMMDQNIIIDDPVTGVQRVIKLTAAQLKEMSKRNAQAAKDGKPLIGYEEAKNLLAKSEPDNLGQPVLQQPVAAQEFKTAQDTAPAVSYTGGGTAQAVVSASVAAAAALVDSAAIKDGVPDFNPITSPRIRVKFVGNFGSLTVPYSHVYRHGINLVMLQYNDEGFFHEPPQGDQPVRVFVNNQLFMCLPGPQFKLSSEGKVFFTVYFIDEEATQAERQQNNGND